MHRGYIKFWRKSLENEFHPSQEKRAYTKWEAWEYLLVHANHKEKWWCGIKISRGELGYSLNHYASEWFWEKTKVWRFLKVLKKRNAITTVNETKTLRISICNYELYQSERNDSATETQRKPQQECNASATQVQPTKECKNVKNVKKERFTAPSVEDVEKYCNENNYDIDAESFVSFYESKGWMIGKTKMTSWKAAVLTWHKRNGGGAKDASKLARYQNVV